MKRTNLLSVLLVVLTGTSATVRQRLDTNGWQFIRMDVAGPWEVFRPAQPGKPESVPLWTDVTLPHCWNAEDAVAPDVRSAMPLALGKNYYQGPGWYRTHLNINNPYPDGRTLLEFEGAGQKTEVYIGLRRVGSHVGGYDKWTVDITEEILPQLLLSIRCDNSRDREMIPSDMSDFCLYGGLYRHVNLVYQPKDYIPEDSIRLTATDRSVSVTVPFAATLSRLPRPLRVAITDPDGRPVYTGPAASDIPIPHPQLWDVDAPRLYTARITYGEQTIVRHFGLRSYDFPAHGPFLLNGRRLLLQGTHRHEDHAGVGAAMTDSMIRRELQQIKDMGANFIRLGHYQQSDLVLHLCDSLGILVWEELPWCRGGLGGERYQSQARRMLTNMINQHRHHPSIILWGLGNENDWPGDFPSFSKDSIRAFMASLNTLAHQLDPTRKTSIRRCDFCSDIVDVYSPTIWAGWYARSMRDYRDMEEAAMAKHPRFFHAEWGGDSHVGRFTDSDYADMVQGDKYGDWSESYIVRLFDWTLHEQQRMPRLTGSAFWTFKDFATPLRPDNPIPYVNQKGVVQRDGTPKESYYVFQSYWAKKPMVHILGHNWNLRYGQPDEPKEIMVYSNCPEVELFVNGQSQGRRHRNTDDFPAAGLRWNVSLQSGENHLRAVGYSSKAQAEDCITQTLQTTRWGTPARLELRQDGDLIHVQITDANGTPCLDAANWITFSLAGDGRLLQNQGTATGSRRIQAANGHAAIRLQTVTGPCVISACSPGLETAFIRLTKIGETKTPHLLH